MDLCPHRIEDRVGRPFIVSYGFEKRHRESAAVQFGRQRNEATVEQPLQHTLRSHRPRDEVQADRDPPQLTD